MANSRPTSPAFTDPAVQNFDEPLGVGPRYQPADIDLYNACDAEVTAGLRSPESPFLLSRKQPKPATFVEGVPVAAGTGW